MKGEQVKELFQKTSVKVTGIVLAVAIAIGGVWAANYQATSVPELVSYVDTEEVVAVEEEAVPLANQKTTTSTSTKTQTTTKKVKLSSKAKKTYTSKGKATTKTSTKTATSTASTASATTTTKTTTKTAVQTQTTKKYTKNSKVCKQTTTTKTTVTKTVTTSTATTSAAASAASTASTTSSSTSSTLTTAQALATVDSRVATAWNTLGFAFKVNSGASYSGYFDASSRTITLKTLDDTIYHELGHFLAFVAGNVDTSSSFKAVYSAEKSLYTKYNASYVTQDASEYFAESFKEYTEDAASLKASRPQTYAAIEAALNKLTTAQITKIATVYASVWS
ncbi:MAG: hypothetical protein LIO99_10270 [Clostridiales bacterium]|nr:hypothetical protein [Clostridiales bacterium]